MLENALVSSGFHEIAVNVFLQIELRAKAIMMIYLHPFVLALKQRESVSPHQALSKQQTQKSNTHSQNLLC